LIPSTILFIAFHRADIALQIRFVDRDFCPELSRWQQLKRSGIVKDFRRIQRVGFGLPCLRDYFVNLSAFEEKSILGESDEVVNEIYRRIDDGLLVVVESISLLECIGKSRIENELENLINLRHPCISAPIGFVVPNESGNLRELKIVRLHLPVSSLSEVLSGNPVWWTSTVKAKVIAGIVLGLRFAHSLGLIHGHLTARHIFFDWEHCIQIVDFDWIGLKVGESKDEDEKATQFG
jgi:hypothetical protein